MVKLGLQHVTHRQIIIELAPLLHAWGYPTGDEKAWRNFARDHHIPPEFLKQLRESTWSDIPRRTLLTLLALAEAKHLPSPIRLEPNAIWTTFESSRAEGFVGIREDNRSLVPADAAILTGWMSARRLSIALCRPEPMAEADLAQLLRTVNCLFIGAPKYNRFTTQALSLLWPAGNGASSLPVRFVWPGWALEGPFTTVRPEVTARELHIGKRQRAVETNGRLAGFAAVCRSPLGTEERVTTVVVAGCSAAATLEMADEIVEGSLYLTEDQLVPGKPVGLIYDNQVSRKRWQILAV